MHLQCYFYHSPKWIISLRFCKSLRKTSFNTTNNSKQLFLKLTSAQIRLWFLLFFDYNIISTFKNSYRGKVSVARQIRVEGRNRLPKSICPISFICLLYCTTLCLLSHVVVKVAPICYKNFHTLYYLPDFVISLAPLCNSKQLSRL